MANTRTFAERHPRLNALIGVVTLLGLAGLSIYGIYSVFTYIVVGIENAVTRLFAAVSSFDAVIIVALITGSVSIVSVVFSSVISKIIDYKQKRREYLYQKREDPYSEFIGVIYKLQERIQNKIEYPESEMSEDMRRFSEKLTLWGSNRVVKKWLKFRELSSKNANGMDTLFIMEDIMFAMRKDMGLRRLKKGSLLAFFINDIQSVMKAVKK